MLKNINQARSIVFLKKKGGGGGARLIQKTFWQAKKICCMLVDCLRAAGALELILTLLTVSFYMQDFL